MLGLTTGLSGPAFAPDAFAAYREAFRDPAVIHAPCEDYRAGATIDYLHDPQDQERGRKISCPVLVLWGEVDEMSKHAPFLDTWKRWADNVIGSGVGCGHFLPEEAPEEVLAHLEPFVGRELQFAGRPSAC